MDGKSYSESVGARLSVSAPEAEAGPLGNSLRYTARPWPRKEAQVLPAGVGWYKLIIQYLGSVAGELLSI